MEQIRDMLVNDIKCRDWIRIDEFHVLIYIRLTDRMLDGKITKTIDLANIEVDFRYQSQGFFTAFLDEVEKMAQEFSRAIYVESILRQFLFDFLIKRGYRVMSPDERSVAKVYPNPCD